MCVFADVVGCDQEQKRRYIEIKQSDLPMSVAAKRTREFRCPPQEQVISRTLSCCHQRFALNDRVFLCSVLQ